MGTPSAGPILPGDTAVGQLPPPFSSKVPLSQRPHASAAYLKQPLALIYGTVQM